MAKNPKAGVAVCSQWVCERASCRARGATAHKPNTNHHPCLPWVALLGRFSFANVGVAQLIFSLFGGFFMRVYYQVIAGFKLSGGKPSLVSLSLHSTSEYFPFLVPSWSSCLSHSRFFKTVNQAKEYINYLYRIYPLCAIPYPVLDNKQLLLF
jgi:hypothetical protein